MKKSIIFLLIALLSPFLARAYSDPSGVWTYHPSVGTDINRMFAAPGKLYYVTLAQPYFDNVAENSVQYSGVHVYDKKEDELRTLTKASGLSGNLPIMAEYNPYGKYLFLTYEDGEIDLLYDNGKIVNIPGLKNADGVNDKSINSVTFSKDKNLAYVATNFGYFTINDKKGEIAESRIYRKPLQAVAEAGSNLIVADGAGQLMFAPLSDSRLNLSAFTRLGASKPVYRLMPLGGNLCGALASDGSAVQLLIIDPDQSDVRSARTMYNVAAQVIDGGHFIGSSNRLLKLRPDGGFDLIMMPSPEADSPHSMASADMVDFWFAKPVTGFYSRKLSKDSGTDVWSNPASPRRPQGLVPFLVSDLAYSPANGFLVPNHGINTLFPSQAHPQPLQLSVLKDGSWSQYGLEQRNPAQTQAFASPNGIAIDPDNPNLVYFGSLLNGFFRLNLSNPADVIHLSRPDSRWDQLPGFVKVHEVNPNWEKLSQISSPVFDAAGNLWCVFNDFGAANPAQLWVWTAEDRKATTKAANYRPMKKITIRDANASASSTVLPLRHASNSNIVVYSDAAANGNIVVVNHQGTLGSSADDRTYKMSLKMLNDAEGNRISASYVFTIQEDPETGRIWAGTESGIFTFSPTGALNGDPNIKQIKVARNDGTGLADYLLDGVTINHIGVDARNRKWISTSGAGLVCVSPDGSDVITSCTTENSDIPGDIVYATVYSPDTQTMMVATNQGVAEYRPYNVGDGTDFESIRAYPNPVRPDYLGYVTIDGLVDNAIVKITDAHGRLVRELGFAANGIVRWDVCDINRRRVGSGVYYVLASTGPDDDSMSKVTKILVIN